MVMVVKEAMVVVVVVEKMVVVVLLGQTRVILAQPMWQW